MGAILHAVSFPRAHPVSRVSNDFTWKEHHFILLHQKCACTHDLTKAEKQHEDAYAHLFHYENQHAQPRIQPYVKQINTYRSIHKH